MLLPTLLLLLGIGLLITGTALIYVPAAFLLAGALIVSLALFADPDRKGRRS